MNKLFCLSSILFFLLSCSGQHDFKKGEFYSLEDLYNKGIISSDDLLNIVFWNNLGDVYDKNNQLVDESEYKIYELSPLDEPVKKDIIENYKVILLEKYQDESDIKENIDLLNISVYCGYYSGYYAIRFNEIFDRATAIEEITLGEYTLHYPVINGEKVQLFKYLN